MQIYIPSVNGITKEYASHLIPSKWLNQFTIRQPIQIYSNSGGFYLLDVNDYESLKDHLLDFFEKNAIPLLNDIISEKDYLSLYENKDKRIIWDDNQYLYIAATYLNNHDLNKAKEVIKNRFGKNGLRKKYNEVIKYFVKFRRMMYEYQMCSYYDNKKL